jgi:2'-5' RNA ligase
LPKETNKALTAYCQEIARQHPNTTIRFTPIPKRHLTLAFLGALDKQQENDVYAVVRRFEHPSLELQLATIARFPDPQSKIITAQPEASMELHSLQTRLQQRLEAKGFPALSRAFRPHITLTRIKDTRDELPITIQPPIALPVRQIVLYESLLTETGSHYTALQQKDLLPAD